MQRAIQVPSSLVVALNGIVVLFVVASAGLRRRTIRSSPAPIAPDRSAVDSAPRALEEVGA
jgi:ABC-type uncharacterized transport system permease subunit